MGDIPKVRPQIYDLPRPQTHEHAHCTERKPFYPFIRAFVRIPKLLLSRSQIVHLGHNLSHKLLDAPQFRLDRLQLLLSLYGRPVPGVGTNVDIKLDVTTGAHHGFYFLRISDGRQVSFQKDSRDVVS